MSDYVRFGTYIVHLRDDFGVIAEIKWSDPDEDSTVYIPYDCMTEEHALLIRSFPGDEFQMVAGIRFQDGKNGKEDVVEVVDVNHIRPVVPPPTTEEVKAFWDKVPKHTVAPIDPEEWL